MARLRKLLSVPPSETNCLHLWKRIRDGSMRIQLVRGPEDDAMSFYYDPKGRGTVYTVHVLVGVFIMLLPEDEREAAISFFKARRARFPDPLPPLPPKVQLPACVVDSAPTQANCRAHWKRIKDDDGTVHLIRGLEDDRLIFTYQTSRSKNTLRVTAYVEQFIALLPEDQRPAAVKFFRLKKARFNEERSLCADGTINQS